MVRNFEDLVLTHRNPVPIERTLLANGIMLAGLESRRLGGKWVDTPELENLILCSALTLALTGSVKAQQYSIVDVQKVPLSGDARQAVVQICPHSRVRWRATS